MKANTTTNALIVVAAIKATRTRFDMLTPSALQTLTDAGYIAKPNKSGGVSILQGSAQHKPTEAYGVLVGLRMVDQRSVDGWRVPGLMIDGKPARVLSVLQLGRRANLSVEWVK